MEIGWVHFCRTLVCGECFGCEICVCRSALMESNKYGCVWIALLAHRLVLGYVLEARYVVCIRMFLLCTVGLCAHSDLISKVFVTRWVLSVCVGSAFASTLAHTPERGCGAWFRPCVHRI